MDLRNLDGERRDTPLTEGRHRRGAAAENPYAGFYVSHAKGPEPEGDAPDLNTPAYPTIQSSEPTPSPVSAPASSTLGSNAPKKLSGAALKAAKWEMEQLQNFMGNAYGLNKVDVGMGIQCGLSELRLLAANASFMAGAFSGFMSVIGAITALEAICGHLVVSAQIGGNLAISMAVLGSAFAVQFVDNRLIKKHLGISYNHWFASTIGRIFNTPAAEVDRVIWNAYKGPKDQGSRAVRIRPLLNELKERISSAENAKD